MKKNPTSSFIRIIILSIFCSINVVLVLAGIAVVLYMALWILSDLFSTTLGRILVVAVVCLTLLFLYIFYKIDILSSDHNFR